jgi:hypothetical protein
LSERSVVAWLREPEVIDILIAPDGRR